MNNYLYYIYGYVVQTDISLKLEIYNNNVCPDITLTSYNINNSDENDLLIYYKNNNYYLDSKICQYTIDLVGKKIIAYFNSEENLQSTVYNIPFSVISILNNNLLLHACSIEIENKVIAFCGKKGTGKSTLLSHLCKKANFYSDDTLNIKLKSNEIFTYNSYKTIKLTEESLSTHKITCFDKYKRNIQNKLYVPIGDLNNQQFVENDLKLKYIYYLEKDSSVNTVVIKKVNDYFTKCLLLLNSIVGIDYLSLELITKMKNSKIFIEILKKIDFYKFIMPDDLKKVSTNADILIEHLQSTLLL